MFFPKQAAVLTEKTRNGAEIGLLFRFGKVPICKQMGGFAYISSAPTSPKDLLFVKKSAHCAHARYIIIMNFSAARLCVLILFLYLCSDIQA